MKLSITETIEHIKNQIGLELKLSKNFDKIKRKAGKKFFNIDCERSEKLKIIDQISKISGIDKKIKNVCSGGVSSVTIYI